MGNAGGLIFLILMEIIVFFNPTAYFAHERTEYYSRVLSSSTSKCSLCPRAVKFESSNGSMLKLELAQRDNGVLVFSFST